MRREDRYDGFIPKQCFTPQAAAALCLRAARVLRLEGNLELARLAVVDATHLRLKKLGKVAERKFERSNGNPLVCIFCKAEYLDKGSMERHVLTHAE